MALLIGLSVKILYGRCPVAVKIACFSVFSTNIRIIGCANQGAILGDVYNSDHGPAWACGYSGQSSGEWVNVSSCTMGGYVGSYTTYKDNPTSAPAATVHNAFSYKNDEYYDPTINN